MGVFCERLRFFGVWIRLKPTVDRYYLPVDKASRTRGQETRCVGDILGSSPAAKHAFLLSPLLPVRVSRLGPLCLNPARCQAIHANFRGKRLGEAARESHDRPLDRGKQLATFTFHANLSLIPSHVQNDSLSASFHFFPNQPAQSHRAQNVNLPKFP